jgi:4-hydroxy-2-oxoheptanedioate aldolase
VKDVDVFFVAPGDLAQSMGYPGHTNHPQVVAAIEDALRRIRAAGRVSGTLTTPQLLARHLELGVQFLYVGLGSLLEPASTDFVRRVHSGEPRLVSR